MSIVTKSTLVFTSFLLVSVCQADLLITGFSATDEETSVVWQGFGFQVTAPTTVSGFGVIDLNAPGIEAVQARLWRVDGTFASTELASADFVGGTAEDLAVSAAFQYAGATGGLAVNGFRLDEFDGGDVSLLTGETYIIAVRALIADPFNPAPGDGFEYFQSVTGTGIPGIDVTVSSPFEILSSQASAGPLTGGTALAGGSGDQISLNYYGLQGFVTAGGGDIDVPPFNSLPDTAFDFNPIAVNLFTGSIADNTPMDPPDPVVPEPSSALLMALALVGGGVILRSRKQVSDS